MLAASPRARYRRPRSRAGPALSLPKGHGVVASSQ
jgi:hypothetical protein